MYYFYKLTLRNGMIYNIKDKESNITKFMESITKKYSWRDFLLSDEYFYTYDKDEKSITVNTIMILTSEIIAVEYATEKY